MHKQIRESCQSGFQSMETGWLYFVVNQQTETKLHQNLKGLKSLFYFLLWPGPEDWNHFCLVLQKQKDAKKACIQGCRLEILFDAGQNCTDLSCRFPQFLPDQVL